MEYPPPFPFPVDRHTASVILTECPPMLLRSPYGHAAVMCCYPPTEARIIGLLPPHMLRPTTELCGIWYRRQWNVHKSVGIFQANYMMETDFTKSNRRYEILHPSYVYWNMTAKYRESWAARIIQACFRRYRTRFRARLLAVIKRLPYPVCKYSVLQSISEAGR